MKRFMCGTLLALSTLAITGCCCSKAVRSDVLAGTVPVQQSNFFLPQVIYAVPGVECNIYFKNIFLALNQSNYMYDVNCAVGKQRLKRWYFTPGDNDAGKSYKLDIKVYDQNENLVAQGSCEIRVAPRNAGKGKKVSILMIGDSLTNATAYPRQLKTLCQGTDNPELKMIGTHAGGGRKIGADGVAHEGYGGWKWNTFLEKYNTKSQSYGAKSKFLFPQNDGTLKFSVKDYLEKYNNGAKPDIVTFQLGVNDVFWAKKHSIDQFSKYILANADRLIAAMRKELPDALFGVGFVTPGADQNAFAVSYHCGQTSWDYYRNHFRLNQAMAKHIAEKYKDGKLVMIPVNVNLDTENNFPARPVKKNFHNPDTGLCQNNGVHPAVIGYKQMGDSYYAWLKNMLAK